MNLKNILIALLVLSLFIETTIFSFPFIFAFSILLYILFPDARTVFSVFAASLLIDVLKAAPPGVSALAIFITLLAIDLYRRVFEIKDYKIMLLIICAFSFAYAKFASYTDNLIVYLVIFGGFGLLFAYFHKKKLLW